MTIVPVSLSGGVTPSGTTGDPNAPPAPPQRVPASREACTDSADLLAWLCAKHRATYLRSIPAPDVVRVTLITRGGDAWSGEGATTAAALDALEAKLGES